MVCVSLIIRDELWRDALTFVLSDQEDIKVVSALACISEAAEDIASRQSDVCIVNVDSNDAYNNLYFLSRFNDTTPKRRVLALIDRAIAGNIREALDYVHGFVSYHTELSFLIDSIRSIANGERVIEPALAKAAVLATPNPLTQRERDVMRLVMAGMKGKEIARQLHLAHGTVRNVTASVLEKLGARNRVDAVRIGTNAGWL